MNFDDMIHPYFMWSTSFSHPVPIWPICFWYLFGSVIPVALDVLRGCTERAIPVKIFFAEEEVKKAKRSEPVIHCWAVAV